MNFDLVPLWGVAGASDSNGARAVFEWGRARSTADWILPLAVFAVGVLFVIRMYRRDTLAAKRTTRWCLTILRLTAITGLLLIYLQPQWRNESDSVVHSRVEILADTSLSMGLTDPSNETSESGDPNSAASAPSATRAKRLADWLSDPRILGELRRKHDLVGWRFDEEAARIGALPRLARLDQALSSADSSVESTRSASDEGDLILLWTAVTALGLFMFTSIGCVVAHEADSKRIKIPAAIAILSLITALACAGTLVTRRTNRELLVLMGIEPAIELGSTKGTKNDDRESGLASEDESIDWAKELAPRGTATQLGQALKRVIEEERASPVSGIVLFSDGRQNAGLDPSRAVELAKEAKIPIYPVGLGSARPVANVRIVDLQAPQRAYPADKYTVTAYLQAQGFPADEVAVGVDLLSREAGGENPSNDAGARIEGQREVKLPPSREAVPVRFEVRPTEVGRRTLILRLRPPAADVNPTDDRQEADIEIVDRKTRVLLFAGGPTRDYQFLRNQLRRGKDVEVDVLLQTGSDGISQDAERILDSFPATTQELFEYDCIVAFDPDWRALDDSTLDLLDRWVGDQAGGLVVVAGPIFTEALSEDPRLAKVRALYPIEFQKRFANLDDNRFGAKEPAPIEFTADGRQAEFLYLADNQTESERAWSNFPGVFGYFWVKGPKPGATVFGHFSGPAAGGQKPVYLAGQFFGAGRIFYLGSGELWRLRGSDLDYFDRLYTAIIRHVSQGRLSRGSSRGVLLTEKDRYLLGATIDARAQVTDERLEPLEAASVNLEVSLPDGTLQNVALNADPSRAGSFRGQFMARSEGTYRLELPLAGGDEPRLTRRVQVKVSDLEREQTTRNDALLEEIAAKTGGVYYRTLEEAWHGRSSPNDGKIAGESAESLPSIKPLAEMLRDRDRVITLPAKPDRLWDNAWALGALCGVLSAEWLLRRLVKLA